MASEGATSDHFDGTEFRNLEGVPAGRSLWDVLRWKWFGGPVAKWPRNTLRDLVPPAIPERVGDGEVASTFVGHSTFLLQFPRGLNVLTDPVWSDRVSPVSFAGPRRVRPPALRFEELPPIQTVLVSHAHYDHLDLKTLQRLEKQFSPQFITGMGNKAFLETQGLKRVKELDWWQSCGMDFGGAGNDWTVTFTPAQHWSARSFTKRNRTLWGGFWFQSETPGTPRVYFAGDSGMGTHFSTIQARLGPPDLAFLPIGAYEPRWFMQQQHMNPEEAVQAHLALRARRSVAMHFGTFQLTDEGIDHPALALEQSLQRHKLDRRDFLVPNFGETLYSQGSKN